MSHDIFTEPYVHEGGDQQVSIGWFREDGDFQIVCTLRSLYFLTPSYQLGFEFAVTMLKTMLEYTIGFPLEVLVRQDCPEVVETYPDPGYFLGLEPYLHPDDKPMILTFGVALPEDYKDEVLQSLHPVATLNGEDVMLPSEFTMLVQQTQELLSWLCCQSVRHRHQQDVPDIVEVD